VLVQVVFNNRTFLQTQGLKGNNLCPVLREREMWGSWLWSHGSWIYNYQCNQCLSQQNLRVRIPLIASCTHYNIMWKSLSVTCH